MRASSLSLEAFADLYSRSFDGGPVDPTFSVIKVVRPDGQPLAFITNYAVHNNAASAAPHRSAISADFSGVMADTLRQVVGPEVVTLFLPGAMGDINGIKPNDPGQDLH